AGRGGVGWVGGGEGGGGGRGGAGGGGGGGGGGEGGGPCRCKRRSFGARWGAGAGGTSRSTKAWVVGFMLRHSGRSSWPVFTPNGTTGSTTTRAPRSHAMRAASSAIRSVSTLSVE